MQEKWNFINDFRRGPALSEGKDELFKRFPRIKYLESLNDLEDYIETYK